MQRIRGVFNPGLVPADPDDLDTCLADGENDCGVDFLSRSDGTVLIIQAKFRGYGVNEELDDVVGICEVLRRIGTQRYRIQFRVLKWRVGWVADPSTPPRRTYWTLRMPQFSKTERCGTRKFKGVSFG